MTIFLKKKTKKIYTLECVDLGSRYWFMSFEDAVKHAEVMGSKKYIVKEEEVPA